MLQRIWRALCSLQLTIWCMSLLMALVLLCTLGQVSMGTFGAVDHYMRSWFVMYRPPQGFAIPIFPGGALVGALLSLNLAAALIQRLDRNWRKAGLWLVHLGLVVLVAGEFVTGALQVDTRMTLQEGETTAFLEDYRAVELALIDTSDPSGDRVHAVPASRLAKGGTVAIPGTPLTLKVHRHFPNAELRNRAPQDPPSPATMGIGPGISVREKPVATADNDMNLASAFVEPIAGGRSYGTWLVSMALGAPQSFIHEGRSYRMVMRSQRTYLPFSLTLKKFSHDKYPGTEIPKNFSSLVRLVDPAKGQDRDVLISMNQPLRYGGRAFYQSSFQGETVSILQVVENPGWLLPYVSTVLVTVGLLLHFALSLRRSMKPRAPKEA